MKLKSIFYVAKTILLFNSLAVMPEPAAVQVRNPAQAVGTALAYFKSKSLPQAPPPSTTWSEKILYTEGNMDYAITGKLFTSTMWKIEVTQDVAPLSRTVYLVTVFNSQSGWYWKGSVKADGGILEINACQFLPEKEAGETEAEFVRKSHIPPPRPGGYGH